MIELLHEIESVRGIPAELMCAALEEALAIAYGRHAGDANAIVRVDRETALPTVFRRRVVVEHALEPSTQIPIDVAPPGYELGDFVDEPVVVDAKWGRLAAMTAKRVIAQRVIEFERERVWAKYRPLQGTIVRGLVQRVDRGAVYVVFDDGHEAVLPASELAPRDRFAINDFLDAELLVVAKTKRGPALILSRNRASYVRALYGPGILAAARRAGFVTYLATYDRPEYPSLIASHIGERVELVPWSHDPAELAKVVFPAGAETFAIDEHRVVFVEAAEVTPLQLDLAMQLTGWHVIAAPPGRADDALEAHLATVAADPPPAEGAIDPELVAKLEEFARERAAAEDAEA